MDLFELLFIALFVLIPVLDGILKKGKRPPPTEEEGAARPAGGLPRGDRGERGPGRDPRGGLGGAAQPGPASDMVPEDLWAILTGERRPSGPATMEAPERDAYGERAYEEPTFEEAGFEERSFEERSFEEAGFEKDPCSVEPELPGEPVSLEYMGPEAYSLETPPPPPEVRHAQFHRTLDRLEVAAPKRKRPLLRALTRPSGLRDAVILAEVLGPPRGLD